MTDDRRPIVDPATGEVIDGWYAHPAADPFPMARPDRLAVERVEVVEADALEVAELVPLADVPAHRPHLTVRHLRRLVAGREVPFYRVGRRICFRLADLDAWVVARRVPAGSRPATPDQPRTDTA